MLRFCTLRYTTGTSLEVVNETRVMAPTIQPGVMDIRAFGGVLSSRAVPGSRFNQESFPPQSNR